MYSVTKDYLEWNNGTLAVNYTTSDLVATVDSGYKISGKLVACDTIEWNDMLLVRWQKIPDVKEVHVIFMNHLDVGYNGIKRTGFINNVLNVYFDEYFPRAVELGATLSLNASSNRQFIYTTHPWLVYLYLNCPANLTLNNIRLHCPSPGNVSVFEAAISKGYIRWHAGPMNMQMDLMNDRMMDVAMWFSAQLDKKYLNKAGNYPRVWSLRDVPGMTKSVISYFLKNGIVALSVGVNPSSSPPDLPDLFLWKENESDKDGLIAFWNKGGYPGSPGTSVSNPVGLAVRRTLFSPLDKQALVFAFRTDNHGPPSSTDEILSNFNTIESEYPDAVVHASTFEDFVGKITKSNLPVVTKEVGDTWVQGVSSDPRKTALYKAAMRALECNPPDCIWGWDAVKDFAPYLIKLPEHTWGLPSVYDTLHWTNKDFRRMLNTTSFVNGRESWAEQRQFFNLTLEAAYQSSSSKWYANNLKMEMAGMYPSIPSLSGYSEADLTVTYAINSTAGHWKIGFLKTGAIGELTFTGKSGASFSLVDQYHALGELKYFTYNGTDFDFMNSHYNYYGNAGFCKPASDALAHPSSLEATFYVRNFYTNNSATEGNQWHFLMELGGEDVLHESYGSPDTVWILVQVGPSAIAGALLEVNFEVTLFNKTATRLAEGTMFSFVPSAGGYRGYYHKISSTSSIPFESVVKNGSQYQHGVESVTLTRDSKNDNDSFTLQLSSLDVAIVCPILGNVNYKTPTPFPAPMDPIDINNLKGVAFNIHNNIWNTNYPLWYPYLEEDKDFKSRYTMTVFKDFRVHY